jgi:hypothetical protein
VKGPMPLQKAFFRTELQEGERDKLTKPLQETNKEMKKIELT